MLAAEANRVMPKPKLSGLLAQAPRSFWLAWACGLLSASVATARGESFTFTTLAGSAGNFGSTDGTNGTARFLSPTGAALDSATNLYVTDGNAIRRLSQSGTNWVVSTLAGVAGQHGAFDGTNSSARFNFPNDVAVDGAGNLYVADTYNDDIRKVTPVGTNWVVSTIAGVAGTNGPADGTNSGARFNNPYGIALDGAGNLYVADTGNNTIRKVAPAGTNWVVSTIAGQAGPGGSADGTNATARFNGPAALAVDSTNNIYVADFGNNTIRKVTPMGTNWVVSTLAGLALASGSADGTNNNARFNQPQGIAVDAGGRLYVADSGNDTIRKLRPAGTNWIVTTLAGLAGATGSADGTGSAARFNSPDGIAIDSGGSAYVVDAGNFTVRLGRLAILLEINRSASQVNVSWPVAATGFVLEARSSLPGSGSWLRLTNGVATSNESFVFSTNASGASFFYRLHKP